MDQQQYQEEYYEDYTPPSNKWLWAVTILAVIAAIVFAVLWYLRGGAVDRLAGELQTAQSSAETSARRLQTDLDQARSDIDAGQTRAAELEARVQEEQRRSADAVRRAESRLQGEITAQAARLADADSQMEDLRRQLAEAAERENAAQSGVAAQARLSAALAAGAKAEALEKELAAARKTIADLEATAAQPREAGGDGRELTAVKARLAASEADFAKAKADLEAKLRAATAAAAEEQLAALNARLAEAGRNIGALETKVADLETNRGNLAKELTSANAEARAAVAARERAENALAEARQRGERAEKALADRISEAGEALKTRERELIEAGNAFRARERELSAAVEAFKARERELREEFENQRDEWQKRVDALQKAMVETGQSRKTGPENAGAGERVEESRPSVRVSPEAAVAVAEPRHVIKGNPARFVGRVVQALPDNRTFLITGGVRQRINPGMVFDVHRCLPGVNMNRYIGLLRVTRVLDDFSLAILTSPSHEARVCPVTGRVVLDGAKLASPYAEVEGGMPVPLISAASLGLGGEMPAAGDVIDNPYYDPGRSLVFSVGEGVKADPRVAPMVAGLGGVLGDDPRVSDYQVAGEVGTNPRQVTLDMLGDYLEPSLPFHRQ